MDGKKRAWWYEDYGDIISRIVKYGNLYVRYCKRLSDFGTDYQVSLFDLQIIEKVYLKEDKYMKMAELAEELGMTQSAFSKNINRLVGMGLIKKYRSENNKKDIFLRVTEKGKETYEQHSKYVYDKIFSQIIPIFQQMSEDQIDKFGEVLDIMGEFPRLLEEKDQQKLKLMPVDEL